MEKSLNRITYLLRKDILYVFLTVVSSVILPQIFHALGVLTSTGALMGQMFMPMYLPVLILGFCHDRITGMVAGILSPIISFVITDMPSAIILPFMIIELCSFGFFAGFLKNKKLNPFLKVIIVQLISRLIRITATVIYIYLLGKNTVTIASTLNGFVTAIPGALLQILIVPYIVKKIGVVNNEK